MQTFYATKFFCNPFLQTQNMKTSRGPTPKCYTFLETSHDPQLESQLRCQNFANFLQPIFANPEYEIFQRSNFWKSLMTPNLNPNSDANFLCNQIFLQPHLTFPFPLPLSLNPYTFYPYPFYPYPFTLVATLLTPV